MACTFTTGIKMTPVSDVLSSRTPTTDTDGEGGRLTFIGDEKTSPWIELQAGQINQPVLRQSWMDLHDILNMNTNEADSCAPEKDCHVDHNANVVSQESFLVNGTSLDEDLTHGVNIFSSPFDAADSAASGHSTECRKRRLSSSSSNEPTPASEFPKASLDPEDEKRSVDLFTSIAKAILASMDGQIMLADIYSHMIASHATYRNDTYKNWRVRVRHVLSVNSCFVKGKRAKSGRGFYWTIHPACLDTFRAGDISKRRASQLVKQWQREQMHLERLRSGNNLTDKDRVQDNQDPEGLVIPDRVAHHHRVYVPMTSVTLSEYDYYELLMNLSNCRKQQ